MDSVSQSFTSVFLVPYVLYSMLSTLLDAGEVKLKAEPILPVGCLWGKRDP